MKDSGRSGVSSRIGRIHPSICRAQNVETEKPKVKRAPLRSFCYISLHTNGKPYNPHPPPPPVNNFRRRVTIERAEDMDRWMSDFSTSFWLALELQKKMRKNTLISCHIIHKFSPQKICYHLLQIAAAGCGALEKSWHSMYAITP